MNKIPILIIAFLILGISLNVQQHTNQSNVEPTHEERDGVVGENTAESIHSKRGSVDDRYIKVQTEVGEFAKASYYDRSVCGQRIYGETCKTANGEVFSENAYTMACSNDFSLGDRVELCYLSNCITARCNDRGNFERLGRTFDFSRGLFRAFADVGLGVIEVQWKLIK